MPGDPGIMVAIAGPRTFPAILRAGPLGNEPIAIGGLYVRLDVKYQELEPSLELP